MSLLDDLMGEIGLPALMSAQGEAVRFYPRTGPPRTVTVIPDHQANSEQTGHRDQDEDRFTCTVFRDPDTPLYGGIEQPALNDAIERTVDPTGAERYRFHHVEKSTTVAWRLVFRRHANRVQQGPRMTVAAGSMSIQLQLLEDLLSSSTVFQQRVRAADQDEARSSIFWGCIEELEGVVQPPFAVIDLDNEWGFERVASGLQHHLRHDGALVLYLTDLDPYSEDLALVSIRRGMVDFFNFAGQLVDFLRDNAGKDQGSGECLSIVDIRADGPPMRDSLRDASGLARWECTFLLHLGI